MAACKMSRGFGMREGSTEVNALVKLTLRED